MNGVRINGVLKGHTTPSKTKFFFFFIFCFCFLSLFCFVLILNWGRLQGQRANGRRLEDEWDLDAWCDIHNESIKKKQNLKKQTKNELNFDSVPSPLFPSYSSNLRFPRKQTIARISVFFEDINTYVQVHAYIQCWLTHFQKKKNCVKKILDRMSFKRTHCGSGPLIFRFWYWLSTVSWVVSKFPLLFLFIAFPSS